MSVLNLNLTPKRAHGILVLVFAIIGALFVLPAQPAKARPADGPHVQGCLSSIDTRGNHWKNDAYYVTWHGTIPRSHKIRVSGTLRYWYCPNKRYPNKVKPRSIRWCYRHEPSVPLLFNGVRYNAFIWDGAGQNVNPGAFVIDDNWSTHECRVQHISVHKQAWLLMGFHPRWKASLDIRLRVVPDWDVRMRVGKHHFRKFIKPHNDLILSDWRH